MATASIAKRIRLTVRAINKTTGSKRARFEHKLSFLKALPPTARFYKGPKIQYQGGY